MERIINLMGSIFFFNAAIFLSVGVGAVCLYSHIPIIATVFLLGLSLPVSGLCLCVSIGAWEDFRKP